MVEPKALLVDFDGTIVDSSAAWVSAILGVCQESDLPTPEEGEIRSLFGHSVDEILLRLLPSISDESRDRAKARFGQMLSDQLHKTPPLSGITELFAKAKGRWPVAVVSGSPSAAIEGYLKEHHLCDEVSLIVGVESYQHGKPSPEPWLVACERLGVAPNQTIAIEDSRAGVESAKAAGCYTIGVRAGNPDVPVDLRDADVVVDTVTDLMQWPVFQPLQGPR